MKTIATTVLMAGIATMFVTSSLGGENAAPLVKRLQSPQNPAQETVLVGRASAGDMIVQLELEPAKGMWMRMGTPADWGLHGVAPGELYHVEVKPIDPKSKTRIPDAPVHFVAVNITNGGKVDGDLHAMWGGSGLHYAFNSGLAGDGSYEAIVTIGVPTFARSPNDADLWMEPTTATFHFVLTDGKLTEVSEPVELTKLN